MLNGIKIITSFLILALVACGGGSGSGGSSPTPTPTPTPTPSYTITTVVGSGGSVSPFNSTASLGDLVQLTLLPDADYTSVVDSSCGGQLVDNIFTINAIESDCTIDVSFELLPPTIASFDVSPRWAAPGESVTLRAEFSRGTGSISDGLGEIASQSELVVDAVNQTKTYTLTVTNGAGVSTSAHTTVYGPKRVVASQQAALLLDDSGEVWQLGAGASTPTKLNGLENIVEVANGRSHNLALSNTGQVWAWGYHLYQRTEDPSSRSSESPVQLTGLDNVKAIAAIGQRSFALKFDGTLWAWGGNGFGALGDGTEIMLHYRPVRVAGLENIVAVATGGLHGLALSDDGRVWAWGTNDSSNLGREYPDTDYSTVPIQVQGLADIVAVAAGSGHSLALRKDGVIFGWGANFNGQLGSTLANIQVTPQIISELSHVVNIFGSKGQSFALLADGTAWAWGENYEGQLGIGRISQTEMVPVKIDFAEKIEMLAAGFESTFAVQSNGSVWAWGKNSSGQIGDGWPLKRSLPTSTGKTDVVALAVGDGHALARLVDGSVDIWGYAVDVPFNNGRTYDRSSPRQVPELTVVNHVAGGFRHSYAAQADGRVFSWGNNSSGQLGLGHKLAIYDPVEIEGLVDVVQLESGMDFGVAMKSDGTLWAWGRNDQGQIGNGVQEDQLTPAQVSSLGTVEKISTGIAHTLALRTDGSVWAWGSNNNGQIGDGTFETRFSPVQVSGLTNIIEIAAGGFYSLALQSDGTLWAWGDNHYGQLGNGSTTDSAMPIAVLSTSSASLLRAGSYHNLLLDPAGILKAWGANFSGQLGDGTYENRSYPTTIAMFSQVTALAAGAAFSLLVSDDELYSWGADYQGQLGLGRPLRYDTPREVENFRLQ